MTHNAQLSYDLLVTIVSLQYITNPTVVSFPLLSFISDYADLLAVPSAITHEELLQICMHLLD